MTLSLGVSLTRADEKKTDWPFYLDSPAVAPNLVIGSRLPVLRPPPYEPWLFYQMIGWSAEIYPLNAGLLELHFTLYTAVFCVMIGLRNYGSI